MAKLVALALASLFPFVVLGCDGDDASSSSSSSTSSSGGSSSGGSSSSSGSSSGSTSASKVVGGVTIPGGLKLCAQSLTAVSSQTVAGFSWNAVPTATRYAVLAQKAAKDATVTTELFNGIVDPTPQGGGKYEFPERIPGTTYLIEVYALNGSDPVCQLDGVNAITAR